MWKRLGRNVIANVQHFPSVLRQVIRLISASEGFEDVLGGFGPDEWFGVRVPVLDPGADVGFEGIDTAVVAAADELLGEVHAPTRAPTTRRS